MRIALFDLDFTLIPFDSGLAWTRFLVEQGVLGPQAEADHVAAAQRYVAGDLDIRGLQRAYMAPLAAFDERQRLAWRDGFEQAMAARIEPARRALVDAHAGELRAIVTATHRFIAEPFARLFGVDRLVASEDGGDPCHAEHKIAHVHAWLASTGHRLQDFERSSFYSDSFGDVPLLSEVTHPVAVDPDARLRAHALANGWGQVFFFAPSDPSDECQEAAKKKT